MPELAIEHKRDNEHRFLEVDITLNVLDLLTGAIYKLATLVCNAEKCDACHIFFEA